MATIHYRQGDVGIAKIAKSALPKKRQPITPDRGRHVLAYGEVTGHAHVIKAGDATFTRDLDTDRRFLEIMKTATITHEEHDPITLPKGVYEVIPQRQYTPERIENVYD